MTSLRALRTTVGLNAGQNTLGVCAGRVLSHSLLYIHSKKITDRWEAWLFSACDWLKNCQEYTANASVNRIPQSMYSEKSVIMFTSKPLA